MTKDKERDDAMIAEMAEMLRKSRAFIFVHHNKSPLLLEIDALLRGDEPAKLDRYVVAWQEANAAYWSDLHQEPTVRESDQAAAAALRALFEPPVRIIQAAKCLKDGSPKGGSAELCADFILKGDR